MKVNVLLAIFLVNSVVPIISSSSGDLLVAQGDESLNLGLAQNQGTLLAGGLATGFALNAEGLALGDGGNERIVSNQRLALQPRYINEVIRKKPAVVTETVVTPIYERTVNQPRVERTRIELQPQFQNQADIVRNNRRVEETQSNASSRLQNVDVAADIIETRPITRPALLVRRENERFVPGEPQNREEAERVMPTRTSGSTVQRNANRPGDLTRNKLLIQPMFQRTNLDVQLQRGENRVFNHPAETQPVDARTRTRVERINVQGDQLYNQRIVRPAVTTEELNVQFAPSQPISEVMAPLIRPTIKSNEVRRKFYNLEYKVPVERTVRVRVPNYIRVNDYRTVHVPVDEQGNEINVSQGGYNVLGGAGLDNAALARVQGAYGLQGANATSLAEFDDAYQGGQGAVSVNDVLSAEETLADAAINKGNLEFAAGLEAGAEILNAAAFQNQQLNYGEGFLIGGGNQ